MIAIGALASRPAPAQTSAPQHSVSHAQLPTLGDGSELSSADERRLGERIAREIFRDPDYIDDPVLADYVQGIWQPLMAAARLRGELSPELEERFAWQVLMGRDRTVNAFALPGGYLGVHLGLIAVVSSRDELASVLGHELSHVTQRHISRLMSKQSQQTPWMIGAMILGALAASKSTDVGSAMIMGGQAVAAQNQLNFSRDMEREADRVGLGVMTQAGFEPQGFVSMFDKLQQASRLNDNGAYPYLRSHPLTTERIADMQARMPLGAQAVAAPALTMEHAMVAARARALSQGGVDALRTVLDEAQAIAFDSWPRARQAGVLYGAALAAGQLRDFSGAQTYLGRLQGLVREDEAARRLAGWLRVELALAADQVGAAVQALGQMGAVGGAASAVAPRRPAVMLAAAVALRTGDRASLQMQAQVLQSWVVTHPTDALAWQRLSSLYAAQGQTLRAIRAEAEVQVAQLDDAAALDRLRAAQDLAREGRLGAGSAAQDHIEASIIDTRKRQIESRLREKALHK